VFHHFVDHRNFQGTLTKHAYGVRRGEKKASVSRGRVWGTQSREKGGKFLARKKRKTLPKVIRGLNSGSQRKGGLRGGFRENFPKGRPEKNIPHRGKGKHLTKFPEKNGRSSPPEKKIIFTKGRLPVHFH